MNCPGCDSDDVGVYKTTKLPGEIHRVRRCDRCSFTFQTIEKIARHMSRQASYTGYRSSLMTTGNQIPTPNDLSIRENSENTEDLSKGGRGGYEPSGSVPGLLFPDPIRISSSNSVEIAKTGARAKRTTGQAASPQFVEFWVLWPRKVDRAASMASWQRQNLDALAFEVMVGLRAQLAYFARSPIDKVPHGATWLNGRRWEADPSAFVIAPPATNGSAPAPSDSYCGPYHRDSRNWNRPSFTPKPTCPGCKHYRAATQIRQSEPEPLPDWMGPKKPAAWTPEQQAEAEALRKARG